MKIFNSLAAFILLTFSSLATAQTGQDLAPFEMKPDGTIYGIGMSAAQQNIKRLHLYFTSTGRITSAAQIYVEGPTGVSLSVRHRSAGSADAVSLLASSEGWYPLMVRAVDQVKEAKSLTVKQVDAASPGYFNAVVHLKRDACSASGKYLTELVVDLSGVAPALYAKTFSVRIGLKEYPFEGDMASSIKPSSDGKYRGEPILLMSSIAHYGKEYINIVSWKGGRIASSKRIPVVKYVDYKDKALSLARIKGFLNGGKATFEISDGGYVYGVCFSAVRKRQTANGYPM